MSDHQQSKRNVIALSILPIVLLFLAEYILLLAKPFGQSIISHLTIAVLSAQLICQIIFLCGEICNGQRSRLSYWNLYFLIFWGGWLLLTCFQVKVYLPIRLAYACGAILTLTTWRQPKEEQLRRGILWLGMIAGGIGLLLALIPLFLLPMTESLTFNPLLQLVFCIGLAYWGLLVSRNRLDRLIDLLPYFTLIALVASSVFVLVSLSILYLDQQILSWKPFNISCYFITHLFLLVIWGYSIFKKTKMNYWLLLVGTGLSGFSPIWLF
ncbi:hypothetical protein ACFFHK_00205 [Gallibacterium trehalosifermentans]|uniref:Uncharacterized protein n=1 Tax=Gallibacterium trehalosifermentans TaxID=516935 RepID=A0ABV6GXN9_9PAST